MRRFRGVFFDKNAQKWRAQLASPILRELGLGRHLGGWPSDVMAGEAYDRMAICLGVGIHAIHDFCLMHSWHMECQQINTIGQLI